MSNRRTIQISSIPLSDEPNLKIPVAVHEVNLKTPNPNLILIFISTPQATISKPPAY